MENSHLKSVQVTCPPWQLLLRHAVQPEGLSPEQGQSMVDHLAACQACCDLYTALLEGETALRQVAQEVAAAPAGDPHEAFEKLWRRVEAEQTPYHAPKSDRRRLVSRLGALAAAACLLTALGAAWLLWRPCSQAPSVAGSPNAPAAQPTAYAELVGRQGRSPLALDQPVTTDEQPQEILLGGIHRVVMNRDTRATFTASPAKTGKTPYAIQLTRGELYMEVIPGHPFTVTTNNARLEITGTKFDVNADADKTELTLLQGSIRFRPAGNAAAFVDLPAGRASTILGRSAPTSPRDADALAATAWARDLALTNAIASSHPDVDLSALESIRDSWSQSKPVDLDSIVYEKWRDEHSAWFAREFPWIFKIQKVLKDQHSLDVDYIELLMVSGDIWQFHYPRAWNQPIPVFNPAAVHQVCRHYGVDEAALLAAVASGTGRQPGGQPLVEAARDYRAALQRWQPDIASLGQQAEGKYSETKTGDLLLLTLRAGAYLGYTRTASWLWVRSFQNQELPPVATLQQSDPESVGPMILSRDQVWRDRLKRNAAATNRITHILARQVSVPRSHNCATVVPESLQDLPSLLAEVALFAPVYRMDGR